MRTLIVTLDTIIAVHTPTARPKVLRFVHVLVFQWDIRYAPNADAIVTEYRSFMRNVYRLCTRASKMGNVSSCW